MWVREKPDTSAPFLLHHLDSWNNWIILGQDSWNNCIIPWDLKLFSWLSFLRLILALWHNFSCAPFTYFSLVSFFGSTFLKLLEVILCWCNNNLFNEKFYQIAKQNLECTFSSRYWSTISSDFKICWCFFRINEIWSSISWIYMCTWSKFEKIHIVIQIEQNMDAEENVLN